jgi:hypothetical protein
MPLNNRVNYFIQLHLGGFTHLVSISGEFDQLGDELRQFVQFK